LFGQRILVTRPNDIYDHLVYMLEGQGGEVLSSPAIEIGPPDDWAPVDAAIATLSENDWLVFSSANGVQRFLDRLESGGRDLRQLSGVKIACIGPGTAGELARYRLRADLVPPEYRAESLAAALAPHVMGKRCLLIRASRGREVLAEQLAAAGCYVSQVVAYSSRDVQSANPAILQEMAAGRIHWVTVTSSAIAKSLFAQYGQLLQNSRIASISPITTATLAELGVKPVVEAKQYTLPGLVAAMTT
jgi:uroporphyrinogen III methyltransferase / synthase